VSFSKRRGGEGWKKGRGVRGVVKKKKSGRDKEEGKRVHHRCSKTLLRDSFSLL
jgi:hypothetical protein